jgi:class 3 adenylate cyclase
VLFDEVAEPHLVTYPKTVEVLQQIKLALRLLDTSPYSIKREDTFDSATSQTADNAPRPDVFNTMKANAEPNSIPTKTRTILFMDVVGWSKLSTDEIYAYATTGLHTLSSTLKDYDFINTWGDAIVATFDSAKCAAENALRIRDFFANSYPESGVAPGLTCRVSLHVGDVIFCHNALRNGDDIFGEAVHVAARLEPVTMPGNIFCTKRVADMLSEIRGSAPRVWPIGPQNLAKDFDTLELYVVTGPNANDPRPLIPQANKTASTTSHSENDNLPDTSASTRIKGWLNKLPKNRTGEAILLEEIEQQCKLQPGQPYRLLSGLVPGGEGEWNIGELTQHEVILNYKPRPKQSRPRASSWWNNH